MYKVTGVIAALARNGKGFKVGEVWYNVYSAADLGDVKKGDTVEFDFVARNDFKNVQGAVRIKDAAPAAAPSTSGATGGWRGKDPEVQAAIIRQNALTAAVNYVLGTKTAKVSPADVIQVARQFEAYTSGRDTPAPAPTPKAEELSDGVPF